MKRDLRLPPPQRLSSWFRLVNHVVPQQPLTKLRPLLAATLLLTVQNYWIFTLPAQADKVNGSGTPICAVPGQDGSPTVSTGQVNTYFPGADGATANPGATSITVGASTGASNAIKPGDLLLVIQMQGADIDASNTNAYGDGDATNAFAAPANGSTYPAGGVVNGNLAANFTAGNFEYVVATNAISAAGGTINFSSALVNSYINANNTSSVSQGQKRFQVIRVPQYANLTVSGTISATPWNGIAGGVVAIDVAGALTFTGAGMIDVTGQGFRGGGGRQLLGGAGANTDIVSLSTINVNGSKGEGTAGTPKYLFNPANNTLITNASEGYPNGSNGRGAPGNAGGGGTDGRPINNEENAGGGGGGNGGLGGKGGRTWNSALPLGGDGGAPFTASARRLVLGGGGGAGSTNNGTGTPANGLASSGAPGGGMVLLRTGNITGAGTINANGASPAPIPANDASGGGGAGGSVLIIAQNNTTSGLTINANGGRGGTNTGGGAPHGPGGGGAGGVVYYSPGAATTLDGGSPGTTNNNASNFGGATAGDGLATPISTAAADAVTSISGAECKIGVSKSTSTPGPLVAPGTATYTIIASNPVGANRPTAGNVVIREAGLPPGFTHTATPITPVYSDGATGAATVTSTGTSSAPVWSGFTIPPGGSVALTFTANIAAGTAPQKYDNSATVDTQYTNASANVNTVDPAAAPVQSSYDGNLAGNTADNVTIGADSSLQVDKTVALALDNDGSGSTTPGDVLAYTVTVRNTSTTTAVNNIVLNDPVPTNSTYVPNSLQIISGANAGVKSDTSANDQAEFDGSQVIFRLGAGANGSTGGTLGITAAINTTVVEFRVRINDPLPAGITTLSNQAIVSSTGYVNTPSNDPSTPASGDPTVKTIAPRLRLVKRITGIKKAGSATITAVGSYNDLAGDNNDNAVGWPGGASAYLLGALNGSQVPTPSPGAPTPQDEVEYTIYFLSDGASDAQSVALCDFVPNNSTYVPNTFQQAIGAGAPTLISDAIGGADQNGFYASVPATGFPSTVCTGTNNGSGAVVVNVGTVTQSIGAGTPATSYGFIRFRAQVN